MKKFNHLALGLVAVLGLLLPPATLAFSTSPASVLDKLIAGEPLNVGFANYSGYSVQDPRTGEVEGLAINLASYTAGLFGAPVNFVEVDWGDVGLALQAGRIDVFVTVIFILKEREEMMDFSIPFAFFDYAIGIVRKGDDRFQKWQEMNSPEVTVAVAQGEASHLWAQDHLPQANLLVLGGPGVEGFSLVFSAVETGRADIGLADKRSVIDLLRARPETFEARWLDNPPATSPAGLALPEGDRPWQIFLNGVITTLCTNDTMKEWAEEFDTVEVRCPLSNP